MKPSTLREVQMSESAVVNLILALSGGCMDAYSYLYRGEVFANAQTGNMLLFGVNAASGNFAEAMKYFWPVIAFTAGIILADVIRSRIQEVHVHWRQIVLIGEILLLFAVCWIPQSHNDLANMLISLACGMQVETFRSFRGNGIATTMCIGNLRSGTYNFDKYMQTHQKQYIKKAIVYFGVIFFFMLGAIVESVLIRHFAENALYFSVLMLVIACILMIIRREDKESEDKEYDFTGD